MFRPRKLAAAREHSSRRRFSGPWAAIASPPAVRLRALTNSSQGGVSTYTRVASRRPLSPVGLLGLPPSRRTGVGTRKRGRPMTPGMTLNPVEQPFVPATARGRRSC